MEWGPEDQENEWKYVAVKVWGVPHYKVPETWDVTGSQDSVGVTLAEMPNSGEMEPKETMSGS